MGAFGRVLVLALLIAAAFALDRWSLRPDVIVVPPPSAPVVQAPPPASPPVRTRARLADVHRDWGIEGRLVCESRIP